MPCKKKFLELVIFWLAKKMTQRHFFFTLPPLSLVIFATTTVVAFILIHNYRFNFHCYTQCEAAPTQKLAQKWRCDLLQLLVRKIAKGIHLCKPVSLNRPTGPLVSPWFWTPSAWCCYTAFGVSLVLDTQCMVLLYYFSVSLVLDTQYMVLLYGLWFLLGSGHPVHGAAIRPLVSPWF